MEETLDNRSLDLDSTIDTNSGYLLPSEIARLVLGYLRTRGCKDSYSTFLRESEDLVEFRCVVEGGKPAATSLCGLTLSGILEDYCALKLQRIQVSSSSSFDDDHWEKMRVSWMRIEKLMTLQRLEAGRLQNLVAVERERWKHRSFKRKRQNLPTSLPSASGLSVDSSTTILPEESCSDSRCVDEASVISEKSEAAIDRDTVDLGRSKSRMGIESTTELEDKVDHRNEKRLCLNQNKNSNRFLVSEKSEEIVTMRTEEMSESAAQLSSTEMEISPIMGDTTENKKRLCLNHNSDISREIDITEKNLITKKDENSERSTGSSSSVVGGDEDENEKRICLDQYKQNKQYKQTDDLLRIDKTEQIVTNEMKDETFTFSVDLATFPFFKAGNEAGNVRTVCLNQNSEAETLSKTFPNLLTMESKEKETTIPLSSVNFEASHFPQAGNETENMKTLCLKQKRKAKTLSKIAPKLMTVETKEKNDPPDDSSPVKLVAFETNLTRQEAEDSTQNSAKVQSSVHDSSTEQVSDGILANSLSYSESKSGSYISRHSPAFDEVEMTRKLKKLDLAKASSKLMRLKDWNRSSTKCERQRDRRISPVDSTGSPCLGAKASTLSEVQNQINVTEISLVDSDDFTSLNSRNLMSSSESNRVRPEIIRPRQNLFCKSERDTLENPMGFSALDIRDENDSSGNVSVIDARGLDANDTSVSGPENTDLSGFDSGLEAKDSSDLVSVIDARGLNANNSSVLGLKDTPDSSGLVLGIEASCSSGLVSSLEATDLSDVATSFEAKCLSGLEAKDSSGLEAKSSTAVVSKLNGGVIDKDTGAIVATTSQISKKSPVDDDDDKSSKPSTDKKSISRHKYGTANVINETLISKRLKNIKDFSRLKKNISYAVS